MRDRSTRLAVSVRDRAIAISFVMSSSPMVNSTTSRSAAILKASFSESPNKATMHRRKIESRSTQRFHGIAALVGQSILNVFFEADREFVKRNIAVCIEKLGESVSREIRMVRKDGAVLWVREDGKAVRRAANRLIVLVACQDITERKRADDALRQSEMYLAEAQRISRTGSFGWSVASGELIWSEETFRIFEFDRAIMPTLELVLQRTHPEDRDMLQRFVEAVSRDGKDWEVEHRLLMPDG